jgi:trypsin
MKFFQSILLTLATASSVLGATSQGNNTCEIPSRLNRRIVGGQDASSNPFVFALVDRERKDFFCAGTLINSRQILTAAHCVDGRSRSSFEVRGGSRSWERGHRYRITGIHVHSGFNRDTLQDDIAILDLAESCHLPPADLPRSERPPSRGSRVKAMGWGATDRRDRRSVSATLQEATLTVADSRDVRDEWEGVMPVSRSRQFGTHANQWLSTSYRDSGGPILDGNTLVGVISGGTMNPCWFSKPSVHTNVGYYLDWIDRYWPRRSRD